MLRASKQQGLTATTKRTWNLLVFAIGGERLAARTEDVSSVTTWVDSIPVPSRTPFVQAMVKREKEVMAVYDLAGRINRAALGEPLLCLVAKHANGPVAICIDGDMPSLHTVDAGSIQTSVRSDIETLGSFKDEVGEIPVVALQRLG